MKDIKPVFILGNHVQACCWQVARLPRAGETFTATGLSVEPGGKGLNVAIGLHRLGHVVDLMLGCGQDPAGDELLKVLQREGLHRDCVKRFAGASGWGAGLIGADGQNAIAVYPGANLLLNAQHVREQRARIESACLVYGQFETSIEAVTEAFLLAHASGIPTVLNPSPWHNPSDALRASTHTLLVNETEAQALLTPELASWPSNAVDMLSLIHAQLPSLWAQWPALQCLVVTLGSHGAALYMREPQGAEQGQGMYMPAACIEAVDTVGAGDAFAAGFVSSWLRNPAGQGDLPRWQAALHHGQVCGAHMASCRGVLDALPTAAQMQTLAQTHRPGLALSM